ncbi:hypothetical protein [Sphingobacterium sp. xlx-130]|nr:hypothetical protein [Sphingobacterium sp. xlx-130]
MMDILNPFVNNSEKKLLLIGLFCFMLSVCITNYNDILMLGALKIVNAKPKLWYISLYNLSVTVLSNALLLYLFAILKFSKTRFVDVLNTVLIAHIAMFLLLLVSVTPIVADFLKSMEFLVLEHIDNPTALPKDKVLLMVVFGAFSIGCLVLFFTLLVKGMKIAINSKKQSDTIVIVLLVLIWNTALQFLNIYQ